LRQAVVERDRRGGVCGNWGCIPSKAILTDAALFAELKGGARRGILADNLRVDYARVIARSREVADRQAKGVEFLFKKNGIAYHHGAGRLVSGGMAVDGGGLGRELGRAFASQRSDVLRGTRAQSLERHGRGARVPVAGADGARTLEAAQVVVAVGRAPLSEDLGLGEAGVRTEKGFVVVDEN